MIFEYPDNYSVLPIQRKAHLQLQRHVLRIKKADGYNNDVIEAFLNRRDFENVQNEPAVNIVWGPETILNANDIDRSMQNYTVRALVYFDWILKGEDPSLERALIKADCERYFLQPYNYTLPEQDDGTSPTIHNLMFSTITPHGDEQGAPRCKLEMELMVWYRTAIANPYSLEQA